MADSESNEAETSGYIVTETVRFTDFPMSLCAMLIGASYRRNSWRPDKAVYMVTPFGKLPYLEIRTAEGCAPYTPSQCDLFATDWTPAPETDNGK